jgi:hypothetical protein
MEKDETSDATLFRRAAAVMWHRRHVADDCEVEADRLKRADGRFATSAWTADKHFHFLQPMTHRLTRGVLRYHLRRISGAFARAFETDFAGT